MWADTGRRTRSIQTRVLVLAGAGVFCAGTLLTFVSRRSLETLDAQFAAERTRVARVAALAVESSLDEDLRLLTRTAASGHADQTTAPAAVKAVLHDRPEASCAFLLEASGRLVAAAPSTACAGIQAGNDLARTAALRQRPLVADVIANDGIRYVVTAVPYRGLEGAEPGAAAMIIPVPDGRLARLLRQASDASSLDFEIRARDGYTLAASPSHGEVDDRTAAREAVANVGGTPWAVAAAAHAADTPVVSAYRRTSLWVAPGLTIVTLLLGWGIARSVRRPLMTLTRSAERIANGDLTHPIEDTAARRGGSEIARLAVAFERMRQSLATSIASTEAANAQLERRVEERTRQLALANARLEDRERQRQQLIRKLIAAQEEERKRVARELHDETSQSLAALAIAVDVAAAGRDGHSEPLASFRGLVSRIADGIRRLIVDLRPSVLDDLGLVAAIRSFADAHLVRAGVAVRCEFDVDDLRLPATLEIAVFRAVQEALVNIERHARAQSVLVQVSFEGGALTIEIEDDGVGFAPDATATDPESLRGFGLLGMRERIELVGGHVIVESTPGDGTRVLMSVPVVAEAVHV